MVKFGKYLKENAVEEWQSDYVNYKSLKVLVYAIEMSTKPATETDQAFFKSRVTDEALRVERKYRQIRGSCMARLAEIKQTLPTDVQSYLKQEADGFFADDTVSAGVASTVTSSSSGTPSSGKATGHSKTERKEQERRRDRDDQNEEFSSSGDQVSSGAEELAEPQQSDAKTDADEATVAEEMDETEEDQQIDQPSEDADGASAEAGSKQPPKSEKPSDSSSAAAVSIKVVTQSDERGRKSAAVIAATVTDDENNDDEDTNHSGMAGSNTASDLSKPQQKKNSNADDYLKSDEEMKQDSVNGGDTTISPVKMYLGDSLYTHLPPSIHRDILGILQILANLKLFGWQNGEGLRKVIKKYDKRTQSNLTLQFWPDIQRMEFMNERMVDSNISEAAAMLTTRVIPFGSFDVRELVVSGVNLSELSRCIQQLDTVSEVASKPDGLTEVIPMSVEPRSYMANERNFLKWMRMAALTAFMAIMLLAFQHEPVTGILLLILSIFIVIRSFHEYRRRTESFLERVDHNWDDETGAKLLLVSVLLPMVTYLVYLAVFGLENNRFHGLGLKGTVNSVSDKTPNSLSN